MSDRTSMLAQPLQRPSAGRAAAYLGLFVLGAVVGLAGSLVQGGWFPGGLLLALLGEAGLVLGGARAMRQPGRGRSAHAAAGWSPSSSSPPAVRKATSSSPREAAPISSCSAVWQLL